jgi:hypothetical protein
MSRPPPIFRQHDITRAIKGVAQAGVSVAAVKVDRDGAIVITTSAPKESDTPLDAWMQKHAHQA